MIALHDLDGRHTGGIEMEALHAGHASRLKLLDGRGLAGPGGARDDEYEDRHCWTERSLHDGRRPALPRSGRAAVLDSTVD
jgi:hypothetical protein